MTEANGRGVQSVERTLDILEVLAASGREMGATELADAAGLPYATIHRLASTLVARGYVRQQPKSRKYVLGPRLARIGTAAGRATGTWMQPYLQRLVDAVGETANLAVLEDDAAVYVAQASSMRIVRMFTEVGKRVRAHSTAVGKVLLAHQPRAVVEGILDRTGMPASTPNTITHRDQFLTELDNVLERGFALDLEEQEEGVCCVAVPVTLADGWTVALSVSGPAGRMDGASRERILAEMRTVSRELVKVAAARDANLTA